MDKTKIIIIDDEIDFAETLSESISVNLNSEILTFQDLDSAMSKVEQKWPDIILSDVFMATGSGLRLSQDLDKLKLDTPVIYITGMIDNLPNKENVMMLRKPVDMVKLINIIQDKIK